MRHDPTARACTRLRLAHSSVSPLSWLGPTLLVASLALFSATAVGAPGKAPVDVMQVWQRPVSYTHLTLPTIYSV